MDYLDIEVKEDSILGKIKKSKFLWILLIIIIIILILISVIIINLIKSNGKKHKDEKDIILEKIKTNPLYHSQYLLNLFNYTTKLNLTNFNKNQKKLNQKINKIIAEKEKNKNLYITLSTIYGAFLADSMGSFCEFLSQNKNNHLSIYEKESEHIFKPGQVTDDSELAMSQAFAIMDNLNYSSINPHLLYYYYVIWYHSAPKDIGTTTGYSLSLLDIQKTKITDNIIFNDSIKKNIYNNKGNSLSNGFIMRISPFLAWFYMMNKNYIKEVLDGNNNEKYFELYNKIYFEISKDNQITHPNETQPIGASILLFMGLCSMQENYTGKKVLEKVEILFQNNHFNKEENKYEKIFKERFHKLLLIYRDKEFDKFNFFSNVQDDIGNFNHAFNLTVYYLEIFDEKRKSMNLTEIYTNMIYDICDFGGDTDTNGAIAGMVIGSLVGMENFEKKYFDIFLSFYDETRIIYTNTFMYFYVTFLEKISSTKYKPNSNSPVSFNFINMFLNMLYRDIDFV